MADVEKIFVCNIENSNIKSINDIPKDKRGFAGYLSIKGETLKFEYDELTNSTSIYCTSMSKERFMNSKRSYYALKDLGVKHESIKKGRGLDGFVDKMLQKMSDEIERRKIEASKIGYRIKEVPSYVNDISQLGYEDYDALSYLRNKGFQFDFSVEGGTKYLYCINKSANDYNYERVNYSLNIRPIFVESNKEYSVENAAHFIISEMKRCTPEQLKKMKELAFEENKPDSDDYDEAASMLDEIDSTIDSIQKEQYNKLCEEVANQCTAIKDINEFHLEFLAFVSKEIMTYPSKKEKKIAAIKTFICEIIKEDAKEKINSFTGSTLENDNDVPIEINSDILSAIDSLSNKDKTLLKTMLESYLESCNIGLEYLLISNVLDLLQEKISKEEPLPIANKRV